MKLTWWQAVSLVALIAGAVSLVLCIATDINDGLFLPLALGLVLVANLLNVVMNARNAKKG